MVKRYTPEPDSDEVDAVMVGSTLVTSELAIGELWSALLSKERSGLITDYQREQVWEAFLQEIDEDVIRLVPINGVMVRDANEVMARVHPSVPLRTLDALHLATYESVMAGPLFTRDQRMLAAARLLDITVVE